MLPLLSVSQAVIILDFILFLAEHQAAAGARPDRPGPAALDTAGGISIRFPRDKFLLNILTLNLCWTGAPSSLISNLQIKKVDIMTARLQADLVIKVLEML